jgi:hypothetical protein
MEEKEYFLGIVLWYRADKKQGCICSLSGERFLYYEEKLDLLMWSPRPESIIWFRVVFYGEKGYNIVDVRNTIDDDLLQEDVETLEIHMRTAREERKVKEASKLPKQHQSHQSFKETFRKTGGIVYKSRFED